jgi:hypothetical protein
MVSKYQLALCEFFNSDIHGKDESSSIHIDSHFLILKVIEINTFYDFHDYNLIKQYIEILRRQYAQYITTFTQEHPVIRNYSRATIKKEYVSLEIIELIELEGGEHVAIYKTFWLRVFQRKWKKCHERKMQLVRKLLKPRGLLLREMGALFLHRLT